MRGFNSYVFKNIIKELHKVKIIVTVPRLALTNEASVALYGDPVDFVNGEPVQKSINNRITVRLPLSSVIDIYHNDFSIAVPKNQDLRHIVDKLDDVLDRLENSIGNKDKEVYEYVNDFFTNVLKQSRPMLIELEKRNKPTMLGFTDDTILDRHSNKDNYIASNIDLSDVIVN